MFSSARISTSLCEESKAGAITTSSDPVIRKRLVEGVSGKVVYADENSNCLSQASLDGNIQVGNEEESESSNYKDYRPKFPIMWSTRYRIVACVAAGIVFGLAMEKGRGKVLLLYIKKACE